MTGVLFALTEGERIGLLALVGVCVSAGASILAAAVSHRVRRENTSQHGESQRLLVTLADKVDQHGHKLDHIAARVDHAHSRIDNSTRRWRWWK